MVEQTNQLDYIFGSLSDQTRRDILRRVSRKSMSVGEIATHYELTFAAVAKHLEVLNRAKLITKSRLGKQQIVSISPVTMALASRYIETYQQLWEDRLDSLDAFLKTTKKTNK